MPISTIPRRYVVAVGIKNPLTGLHVGEQVRTLEAYQAEEATFQALVEAIAESPEYRYDALSVAPETPTIWSYMTKLTAKIALLRLPLDAAAARRVS